MTKSLLGLTVVAVALTGCPDELQFSSPNAGSTGADSGTLGQDLGSPAVDVGVPTRDTGNPVLDTGVTLRDTGSSPNDVPRMCSAELGEICMSPGECCGSGVTCLADSVRMSQYCTRICSSDCDCLANWSCIDTNTPGRRVCGRGRTNTCGSSCSLRESAECQPSSTSACCAEGRTCGRLNEGAPYANGCCRTQGACSLGDGCCQGYDCRFGSCVRAGSRPCDPTATSSDNGCPLDFSKCVLFLSEFACIRRTGDIPSGGGCTNPGDCANGSGCSTTGTRRCMRFCRTSSPTCSPDQTCVQVYGGYGVCTIL
jgi:hypothetical protein